MSFRIMHNILILIVSFETLLQISKFTNANYATKKFLCKTFIIMYIVQMHNASQNSKEPFNHHGAKIA